MISNQKEKDKRIILLINQTIQLPPHRNTEAESQPTKKGESNTRPIKSPTPKEH